MGRRVEIGSSYAKESFVLQFCFCFSTHLLLPMMLLQRLSLSNGWRHPVMVICCGS